MDRTESMDTVMSTLLLFESEWLVFLKEHTAGTYGVLPFFLAKNIAQVPFVVAYPVLFSSIAYWMVRYSTGTTTFDITAIADSGEDGASD